MFEQLASRLVTPIAAVEPTAVDQLRFDLSSNAPQLTTALQKELRRQKGSTIQTDQVRLRIHRIDEQDFSAESNLESSFGITKAEAHQIVERALLAVGGVNQRLAEMRHYEALVNFWTETYRFLTTGFYISVPKLPRSTPTRGYRRSSRFRCFRTWLSQSSRAISTW